MAPPLGKFIATLGFYKVEPDSYTVPVKFSKFRLLCLTVLMTLFCATCGWFSLLAVLPIVLFMPTPVCPLFSCPFPPFPYPVPPSPTLFLTPPCLSLPCSSLHSAIVPLFISPPCFCSSFHRAYPHLFFPLPCLSLTCSSHLRAFPSPVFPSSVPFPHMFFPLPCFS